MQEVEKKQNEIGFDIFKIMTDKGDFEISFQDNLDLYWKYINKGSRLDLKEKQEIIITKENFFIYELFYKLYESVKRNKVYYGEGKDEFFEVKENNLFKDEKIEWCSDDSNEEVASKLIIEKLEDVFKVTFVKSKDRNKYSVRICNSGSRYAPFNGSFLNMYNELKGYEPDCHQIHMEEMFYNQKVLRK